MFGGLLLSGISLKAQHYLTHDGLVSLFGEKPFTSVRADNHEVEGSLDTKTGDMEFHTLILSFHFKNKSIEKAFDKRYMDADHYPNTGFVGKILDLTQVNFSKPGSYPISVGGNFTIHNVTEWVTHPGTLVVTADGLVAKSHFMVKPEGFKVKVPKLLGRRLVKEINVLVDMDFKLDGGLK